MAVNRFDHRRSLVVAEANAIGTTWLRTDFLQDQAREESRVLLKRYAESRLRAFQDSDDPVAFGKNREIVAELHAGLWAVASLSANRQQNPVVMGYVTALNEMIDLDESRMAASRNHVPGAVWPLLVLVGGCGAWANGYSTGATGVRSIFTVVVFPVLIAIVIVLISDIDQSRRGLIGMSQKPVEDVLKSMSR